MRFLRLQLCAVGAALVLVSAAAAVRPVRPPVLWEPGVEHYTPAHREPGDIRYIVIHTTEGSADGAASWFQNDNSHVSAHYVISRTGEIVQLVRQRNVAWHAGNWAVNTTSIGIEHEGVTDDPSGYTDAEYRASARLVAYICRTWDVAIDRNHIIGHAEVPDPNDPALRGGSDHHTDPGQYWNWPKYMKLVRFYAGKRTLAPRVRIGAVSVGHGHVLTGIVPWRARTTRGVRRVDFRIDGRLVRRDTRRPFVLPRLNTTSLRNGRPMLGASRSWSTVVSWRDGRSRRSCSTGTRVGPRPGRTNSSCAHVRVTDASRAQSSISSSRTTRRRRRRSSRSRRRTARPSAASSRGTCRSPVRSGAWSSSWTASAATWRRGCRSRSSGTRRRRRRGRTRCSSAASAPTGAPPPRPSRSRSRGRPVRARLAAAARLVVVND